MYENWKIFEKTRQTIDNRHVKQIPNPFYNKYIYVSLGSWLAKKRVMASSHPIWSGSSAVQVVRLLMVPTMEGRPALLEAKSKWEK